MTAISLGHNLRLLVKYSTKLLNSPSTTLASKMSLKGLPLSEVVQKLNEFAPLSLAEKWDNVGLLIEPHTQRQIQQVLVTNDLTEAVMQEAVTLGAELIISYHPPVFAPLKRITQATWKERIVAQCLENRIALYSPHTAWDAVNGGVIDWLARSLRVEKSNIRPIFPNAELPDTGAGRICNINGVYDIQSAIDDVRDAIGLKHVNVALGCESKLDTNIKSVALCSGSGASVLKAVEADLYITGEMSHHDVLDATQRNVTVILTNHSNSERGFLREFCKNQTQLQLGQCSYVQSKVDADPLLIH